MIGAPPCPASVHDERLLARLRHDRSGNTLALAAAALLPLVGLLGGGIDMGRGYLSQSRLQQACDAGVLAARKRLGTAAAVTGTIPADAALAGERFFNLNFRDGAYGTERRTFAMVLEQDYAITARATVDVQTTLMAVFGFTSMPVTVECQAQLNMANTDIMMVLDVTGSMAEVNPGDSENRMDVMKATVRSFHAQMLAAAPPSTRLRFGFVPYSTNVNVGHLLTDAWVNTAWHYQSRELFQGPDGSRTYTRNWPTYISGERGQPRELSSYPATYHPEIPGRTYIDSNEKVVTVAPTPARYSCDQPNPAGTYTAVDTQLSTTTEPFAGPPVGTRSIVLMQRVENGIRNYTDREGSTCYSRSQTYTEFTNTYERVTDPVGVAMWRYDRLDRDVSNWRTEGNGCIEERATYPIHDFTNVDLSNALDLDIDLVPTADPATRWSPMYPQIVYARSMRYPTEQYPNGRGSFTPEKVEVKANSDGDFINPNVLGLAACPAKARKLAVTSASDLETYLGTLQPTGATYHDIGMIWGGRLLSPTGLFASENADASATRPSTRHMIFLTDGETAPRDLSYSSYGLEPLDQRRWAPGSPLTLTQTVEKRFSFACDQVKKKNISVWVISFGTAANPIMQGCAGADRYFVADDAEQLQETFATIAKRMGELRVSR